MMVKQMNAIKRKVSKKKDIDEVRKERGRKQKIFLILTHEYDDDCLERKYEVMGTTGNVYTVTICRTPTCSCPDYVTRHKRCKHIYFVLTRIMRIKEDQEDIAHYTDEDLQDMFDNIPQIVDNLKVDTTKLTKFKNLKNGTFEHLMKTITPDDVCPICLDDMYCCEEELIHCKYSCGNALHKECFDMYNKKQHTVKCLFCFGNWNREVQQYINLTQS
jgi:hypothetical protein